VNVTLRLFCLLRQADLHARQCFPQQRPTSSTDLVGLAENECCKVAGPRSITPTKSCAKPRISYRLPCFRLKGRPKRGAPARSAILAQMAASRSMRHTFARDSPTCGPKHNDIVHGHTPTLKIAHQSELPRYSIGLNGSRILNLVWEKATKRAAVRIESSKHHTASSFPMLSKPLPSRLLAGRLTDYKSPALQAVSARPSPSTYSFQSTASDEVTDDMKWPGSDWGRTSGNRLTHRQGLWGILAGPTSLVNTNAPPRPSVWAPACQKRLHVSAAPLSLGDNQRT